MPTVSHDPDNIPELEKIHLLHRFERMFFEERNNDLPEMLESANPKGHPGIVIHSDHSASEKGLQSEEEWNVPSMLHDGKFRKHLEFRGHVRVRIDADEETSFAVNEPNDPVRL